MTWRSFVDYVIMRELGQEDATYRNYDLTFRPGFKAPGVKYTYALSAAERIGVDTKDRPLPWVLDEIRQRLRDVGYIAPAALETTLNEWYIWDRIRKGELQRWRYRSRSNPLL